MDGALDEAGASAKSKASDRSAVCMGAKMLVALGCVNVRFPPIPDIRRSLGL